MTTDAPTPTPELPAYVLIVQDDHAMIPALATAHCAKLVTVSVKARKVTAAYRVVAEGQLGAMAELVDAANAGRITP